MTLHLPCMSEADLIGQRGLSSLSQMSARRPGRDDDGALCSVPWSPVRPRRWDWSRAPPTKILRGRHPYIMRPAVAEPSEPFGPARNQVLGASAQAHPIKML